jgi:hypothetical protein
VTVNPGMLVGPAPSLRPTCHPPSVGVVAKILGGKFLALADASRNIGGRYLIVNNSTSLTIHDMAKAIKVNSHGIRLRPQPSSLLSSPISDAQSPIFSLLHSPQLYACSGGSLTPPPPAKKAPIGCAGWAVRSAECPVSP